jgi:hypothetical protein
MRGELLTKSERSGEPGRFMLQNERMLKVDLAGTGGFFYARQGSMVAYQGAVDFAYEGAGGLGKMFKKALTGEGMSLMKVSGSGDVFLAQDADEIFILELEDEAVTVNGRAVLAFESSLTWDVNRVEGASMMSGGLFNTTFTGRVVGTWLLLWTGYLGGKALVLVHAAVWGIPAPPPPRSWVLSLTFSGTAFALFASMSVTAWLHSSSQALAVLTALASTALPGAIWLAISRLLPHRVAMWRGLVPGAVLVAVGIQAFTIVTIWFLAPKLASATALYGILGVAATFLFWLYILGRLFIAAATLNASLHEQRTASAGIWGPR